MNLNMVFKSTLVAAAFSIASAVMPNAVSAHADDPVNFEDIDDLSYTDCEPLNAFQDICYVYELDFFLWYEFGIVDYILVSVYITTGGGETPPPDTIF